ncbi:hypothetical protein [Dyella sp.]|uniref:hypothetical protein n=1 Tax=Dyella sp. TaxID=1869338 RepID=UPI002D76ADAE|nr:hypothetical protein [Dyella sp.]HET7332900.1 hypothetical protein [Dyella sp.]
MHIPPADLKNKIIVEWLSLDPDKLAADIPVKVFQQANGQDQPYVSLKVIAEYAGEHENKAYEAFVGYKGSHTTDRVGFAYAWDWEEFLDSLRKARTIAAEPYWEPPENGLVYHCLT